ncbi:hypothetical protein Nepgr_027453 [Nepenthes gracilis]|uniref:Uncharacterized protein n=1 Tax=Nepenthes gracilis TaxID=150966 RepID=A0AAD3T8J6_NEPGR|nr:hypothetical protein Nepgr_027453 [Nepenthes gracilis]
MTFVDERRPISITDAASNARLPIPTWLIHNYICLYAILVISLLHPPLLLYPLSLSLSLIIPASGSEKRQDC